MTPIRPEKKRKTKFNNIRCEMDGIGFASKAEMIYYAQLKLRKAAGEVSYFLRQVPLHLPGNIRYVLDFLEVWADGSLHYVDVKGHETREFLTKKKIAEALFPIKIETPKVRRVK